MLELDLVAGRPVAAGSAALAAEAFEQLQAELDAAELAGACLCVCARVREREGVRGRECEGGRAGEGGRERRAQV